MKVLIQKYGGTSLATNKLQQKVVQHIKNALTKEYRVIVVVSAIGRKGDPYATDTLLELIKKTGSSFLPRDLDLLLSCGEIISATTLGSLLRSYDIPCSILTGSQAGIITDDNFSNAQIISVSPHRVRRELHKGNVVIVPGFQGQSSNGEITTLGRGGSDITAASLGVAFHAEMVEIFTDVDGVYTQDPQKAVDSQKYNTISFFDMYHLALKGAKVVHPDAVLIAKKGDIPIKVRSTLKEGRGTLITNKVELEQI